MKRTEKILELFKKDYSNTEIAKECQCTVGNVTECLKRNGLKNNRKRTFDTEKFKELYEQGLNDLEIAPILGMGKSAIQNYRSFLNLPVNYKHKNLVLCQDQKSVLIGGLLGDSYLKLNIKGQTASGMFAHSIKQEKYFWYKKNIMGDFCQKEMYKEQERCGKKHKSIYTHYVSTEHLVPFYNAFYKDRNKQLPNKEFIYENFTDLSFAIWYGDDGYIESSGKGLATNSFSYENQLFLQHLLKKLDIDSHLYGKEINKYSLYLPKSENEKVEKILYKYLLGVLDYKLSCRFKKEFLKLSQGKNGES